MSLIKKKSYPHSKIPSYELAKHSFNKKRLRSILIIYSDSTKTQF